MHRISDLAAASDGEKKVLKVLNLLLFDYSN